MKFNITKKNIENDLQRLGVSVGDTILVRADLSNVGKISRKNFLEALLNVVGTDGTIVSLAFTNSAFIWDADKLNPFKASTPSYAGVLPNAMLEHHNALRSMHPQCSYVAIGKYAEAITFGHGPKSGAYEPIRKVLELKGKMLLIGCVSSSPGFTTTHLAEVDLGLHRRIVMPWLSVSKYFDENGKVKLFKRYDSGSCSKSYWKFYAHYVKHEALNAGMVGNAYSVIADSNKCYEIERDILTNNPKFNICGSADCITCNALRWDRLHHFPKLMLRRLFRKDKK